MTTATLAAPTLLDRLASLFRRSHVSTPRTAEMDRDDAASRRDFVNEMLSRNPDAFSSELDVQNMMHHFPGRF